MTISDQTNRTSVDGSNTVGQEIPYLFPTSASGDLTVTKRLTSTGLPTELTENADDGYTATYSETGGTVTITAAIAATYTIHVVRSTPYTQSLDLVAGGAFSPENVEDAFDKNTKLIIQNKDKIDRSLRFPATDPTTSLVEMPNSIDRAGYVLGFDSTTGAPEAVAALPASSATVTPYMETVLDDGTALIAMATLQGIPVINVRNATYGATGDGSTDDTTAIGLAITAAGSKILYFPEGTYMVSGLTIATAMEIWLADGATIKLIAGSDTDIIAITTTGNVSIHGGTLDGNASNQTANTCVAICATDISNITTKDVTIVDMAGRGIKITGTAEVSHINIDNCTISTTTHRSIYYDVSGGGHDITVSRCTVNQSLEGGTVRGCIKIVGAVGTHITNVRVNDNYVNMSKVGGVYYGIVLTSADESVMQGNFVTGGAAGIGIAGVLTTSVIGNTIKSPTSYGIEVGSNTSDCVVSGNIIDGDGQDTDIGILVTNVGAATDRNVITGNRILNCSQYGIDAVTGPPHYMVISNNIIEFDDTGIMGIRMADGDYCSITGNVIDGQGKIQAGIGCIRANYLSICNNIIHNTTVGGIALTANNFETMDHLRIFGNIISAATDSVKWSGAFGNDIIFEEDGSMNFGHLSYENEGLFYENDELRLLTV